MGGGGGGGGGENEVGINFQTGLPGRKEEVEMMVLGLACRVSRVPSY